jgi:hypothetical protein
MATEKLGYFCRRFLTYYCLFFYDLFIFLAALTFTDKQLLQKDTYLVYLSYTHSS